MDVTCRTAVCSCLLVAGCGRLGFDAHGGAAGDGRAIDDGTVIGGGTANRAFVTNHGFDGALGGIAGADAKCQADADAAHLQGTFVALVSTSTTTAISRLAGSRGWLRMDGAPLVDQAAQLTAQLWNPIDLDEHGTIVDLTGLPWTGTTSAGTTSATTCADWTTNVMATTGSTGWVQSNWPAFLAGGSSSCKNGAPLYCFEVGHVAHVQAAAIAGRVVFISKATYAGGGVAKLDATCASEAAAVGLGSNFAAAVATSTANIPTRIAPDGRAWRRVDGTLIAVGSAFADGTPLRSFVTQHADGSYIDPSAATMTGALDIGSTGSGLDCSDWTDTSSTGQAEVGMPSVVAADGFWTTYSSATVNCNIPSPVVCFER